MIYKGKRWTLSRKIVALPHDMWLGEFRNYVRFGRVCSKYAPNAVKTDLSWEESGSPMSPQGDGLEMKEDGSWHFPVYAIPVEQSSSALGEDHPLRGYSMTNLLRSKDGYAYLMFDGKFYVRKWKKNKG